MTMSGVDLEARLRAFGDVLDRQSRAAVDPVGAGAPVSPRAPVGRGASPARRHGFLLGIAATAIVVVGVGALIGLVALSTETDPETDQALPATAEQVSIDAELLPPRDDTSLPMVLEPSLQGWILTTDAVAVAHRFSDAGVITRYTMRRDGDELTVIVSDGQVRLPATTVAIERPTGQVEASLTSDDDGGWTLDWNERPGIVDGVWVSVTGSPQRAPLEIAEGLRFDERPLTGGQSPRFVPIDDIDPIFAGNLDGVEWVVGRQTDSDEVAIVIGGRSPTITAATASPAPAGTPTIEMTTISRDGAQVSSIVVADDSATVSLAIGDGTTIPLPVRSLPGTDERVAVAALPPGRDAVAVIVTDGDGHETTLGLPVAPAQGWTTMRTHVASN